MPCCRRWATSLALLLMLCAPGETHTGPHCLMRPSAHSGGLVPDRGAVGARVGLALRLRGGARKGGDEKRASHSSVKSPGKDRSSRARSESPPAANAKPAHSSEKSPGKKRDSSGGGGSIPVVSPVKGVSKNKKKKKSGSAATGSGKGKDKAATEEGADGEDKEQSLRSALSEKMGALLGDDLEDDPAKMQRVLEAFSEDNESEEMRAEIASDEKKEANEKANKEARQQEARRHKSLCKASGTSEPRKRNHHNRKLNKYETVDEAGLTERLKLPGNKKCCRHFFQGQGCNSGGKCKFSHVLA